MKKEFIHKHPFKPVVFNDTTKLIVGTLPPPRFSIKGAKLKDEDVLFCYGSADNQLWRILDTIYGLNLEFAVTKNAIDQRLAFLKQYKIGICDSLESAKRTKIDASDNGMGEVVLRNLLKIIKEHEQLDTLLLMGGASKNGPLYFLKQQLSAKNIKLKQVSKQTPKIYQFEYEKRLIEVIALTSPSNAANRAIGANTLYKTKKAKNSSYTTFDFRCDQYKAFFPKPL